MAATNPSLDAMFEDCAACDDETPHDVQVVIRTESKKLQNAQYSREPYRESTCQVCGRMDALRMNNA